MLCQFAFSCGASHANIFYRAGKSGYYVSFKMADGHKGFRLDKTTADLEAVKILLIKARSLRYALDAVDTRVAKAKKILATLKMNPRQKELVAEAQY